MNYIIFALIAVTSGTAVAENFRGEVKNPPQIVTVRTGKNRLKDYLLSASIHRANVWDDDQIALSVNGALKCISPYLGQLAATVSFDVDTDMGDKRTVVVNPAKKGDDIRVWGMCGEQAKELTEIQIEVRSGDIVDVVTTKP